MREILEEADFTDIVENPNGTFNATKDGMRYEGLYLSNVANASESDAVVEETVTFSYKENPDGVA